MAELNDGILVDPKITVRRFPAIEHGPLQEVFAIVVHQTDSASAASTFNSYVKGPNGAHFLIDKTGQIIQTASLAARCYHVGAFIKSKCLQLRRTQCRDPDMARILAMSWVHQKNAIDAHERAKPYPERFPVNEDSIGIELVGKAVDSSAYEQVTLLQNLSLQWLVSELHRIFSLSDADTYRHPDVSYKNPGEARTAKWK